MPRCIAKIERHPFLCEFFATTDIHTLQALDWQSHLTLSYKGIVSPPSPDTYNLLSLAIALEKPVHVAFLFKQLLAKASHDMAAADTLRTLIAQHDYAVFRTAVQNKDKESIAQILDFDRKHLWDMSSALGNQAFRLAAETGDVDLLITMIEEAYHHNGDIAVQNLIQSGGFWAYRVACAHGHTEVMQVLFDNAVKAKLTKDNLADMLGFNMAVEHAPLFQALANGHSDVFFWYLKFHTQDELAKIIFTHAHFYPCLFKQNHMAILDWLKTHYPSQIQDLLLRDGFAPFQIAASHGQTQTINWIVDNAPQARALMLRAGNQKYDAFAAFIAACKHGDLDCVKALLTHSDESDKLTMVTHAKHLAIKTAIASAHLPIVKRLWAEINTHDEARSFFLKEIVSYFKIAVKNGDMETLKWLNSLNQSAEILTQTMQNLDSITLACAHGHADMALYLYHELDDHLQQEFFTTGQWRAILKLACKEGATEIVQWLYQHEAVSMADFYAADTQDSQDKKNFLLALQGGHSDIVKVYLDHANADFIGQLSANDNLFFRTAYEADHDDIVDLLLHHSKIFAYAEMHTREYGLHAVNPFIEHFMQNILDRKAALEIEDPTGVFNLDASEENIVDVCFYIIKNCIRRNYNEDNINEQLNDYIRTLLMIPRVREMAHIGLSHGEDNELLKLALRLNNQEACGILMNIPQVYELAEANDFYRAEIVDNNLDLHALALNNESSMVPLSASEERLIKNVKKHYQAKMESCHIDGFAQGIPSVIEELRQYLEKTYLNHPATITLNGVEKALPLSYDALQVFRIDNQLSASQYQKALKAYYQHEAHTAWRYLSKPNYWMAPNASYVNVYELDPQLRYSTFEDYLPIIATFYLAASDNDETTLPKDEDYTLEGRLGLFVREIALIGRAHNWDSKKRRINQQGQLVEEEFDDLLGDKPSCFGGVKRRLFQSVLGHTMFKTLTKAKVQEELYFFVRNHFKNAINDSERPALLSAYHKYTTDLDPSGLAKLATLNISEAAQQDFIALMAKKYGEQFYEDKSFIKTIQRAFKLRNESDAHFANFCGLCQLKELLLPQSTVQNAQASQFFSQSSSTTTERQHSDVVTLDI